MRRIDRSVLFVFVSLVVACSGSPEEDGGGGGGSARPCTVAADCAAGEGCLARSEGNFCAPRCTDDGDCDSGRRCVEQPSGESLCAPSRPPGTCEHDGECPGNERCIEGACVAECVDDRGCGPDERCDRGACVPECSRDDHCPGDLVCTRGACRPEGYCTSHADCYEDVAYCLEAASSCLEVTCGTLMNDCALCDKGPAGGVGDAGGPLLFEGKQRDGSLVEPIVTCPPSTPYFCSFTFLAWDPDDDLPVANLEAQVRFVDEEGALTPPVEATAEEAEDVTLFAVSGCFPPGRTDAAVVLSDRAGNDSQTLCLPLRNVHCR